MKDMAQRIKPARASNIIFAMFQYRKFYKLNEITCPLSYLLRCIKGPIYEIKPLMRLV